MERLTREDIVNFAVKVVGDVSQQERCAENALPPEEEEEIVGNFYFEGAKWQQFVSSGPGATCRACGCAGVAEKMEKVIKRFPKHIWTGVKALRAIAQELANGKAATMEVALNLLTEKRVSLKAEIMPVMTLLRVLELREGCTKCFKAGKASTRYLGVLTARIPVRVSGHSVGPSSEGNETFWDIARAFDLPLRDPQGPD